VLGASGAVMLIRQLIAELCRATVRLRYSYYAYSKPYTRAPAYFVGMWLVLESYIGVIRQKS
jgi:hypothetical protein